MLKNKILALIFATLPLVSFSVSSSAETHSSKKQSYIEKVVYHINDMESVKVAFNNITNELKENPKAIIHVVTYGKGIDFLLDGTEDNNKYPYNIKVEELQEKGVIFKICNNTLTARNIDKSKILSNVKIVPSGATEIIRLQLQEKFAYFKP